MGAEREREKESWAPSYRRNEVKESKERSAAQLKQQQQQHKKSLSLSLPSDDRVARGSLNRRVVN